MSDYEHLSTVSFELVDAESPMLPLSTAVSATFCDRQGNPLVQADSVRFTGFGKWHDGQASVAWVDSAGEPASMPLETMPGIQYLGDDEDGLPVIAFHYFKQEQGAESDARIVRLKGVAHGVHKGHIGIPERGIPAEKPGWYMVAEQVGLCTSDGEAVWQDPAEKVFPFARIVDGPLGDPRAQHVQEQFGLY